MKYKGAVIKSKADFDRIKGWANSVIITGYWSYLTNGRLSTYDSYKVATLRSLYTSAVNANKLIFLHPGAYGLATVTPTGATPSSRLAHMKWLMKNFPKAHVLDVVNEHVSHPLAEGWLGYYVSAKAASQTMIRAVNETPDLLVTGMQPFLDDCANNIGLVQQIGVQAHMAVGPDIVPMSLVSDNMDKINAIGIPWRLSEVSCPSGDLGWTEAKQADFAINLYTLAATKSNFLGAMWWDLVDPTTFNTATSGMFRKDGSAKPVFNAVKTLTVSW